MDGGQISSTSMRRLDVPARPAKLKTFLLSVSVIMAIGSISLSAWAKGRGYKTWVYRLVNPAYGTHRWANLPQPTVVRTRPADRDGNIFAANAFVAADVELPYPGKVVDGDSLNSSSVLLYRTSDHRFVQSVVNTSGAGDAIVLRPMETLETNTQYTFEVTPAARDTGGHPFRHYLATFWTAGAQRMADFPAAFEKVALPTAAGHMFTCVTMGPDHKLYASTLTGHIFRYTLTSDGTVEASQQIDTVNHANGKLRLITGITFDPASTAEHLSLWVNHGELPHQAEKGQAWIKGAEDWTGKLSRLEGADLEQYQDVLINLPRAWKDHLNNQIAFGHDGALYFCQAANTAMGAADHKWGFRPERLLTAAILRLDVKAMLGRPAPLDVKTEEGGIYDPFASGAPLTIYATGVRNSFDLVWHSNGRLYAGVNGSAAGGNSPGWSNDTPKFPRIDTGLRGPYSGPAVPPLNNVQETEDDMLFIVSPGAYHGHPNPVRGEYILNGGNPSPKANPWQVRAYPLGTQPDRNWQPPIYSFGKNLSPCGVVEYQSHTFGDALKGKLLYVRYSGGDDIIALSLDSQGDVSEAITGIEGFSRLVNPVDLTEDLATGSLYVAEFGGKRITLLRPITGHPTVAASTSHHVCRVRYNPTTLTSGQE